MHLVQNFRRSQEHHLLGNLKALRCLAVRGVNKDLFHGRTHFLDRNVVQGLHLNWSSDGSHLAHGHRFHDRRYASWHGSCSLDIGILRDRLGVCSQLGQGLRGHSHDRRHGLKRDLWHSNWLCLLLREEVVLEDRRRHHGSGLGHVSCELVLNSCNIILVSNLRKCHWCLLEGCLGEDDGLDAGRGDIRPNLVARGLRIVCLFYLRQRLVDEHDLLLLKGRSNSL